MFWRRSSFAIETERLVLRAPQMQDYGPWRELRQISDPFLRPWEPVRSEAHYKRASFRTRVAWAGRAVADGRALPLMIFADGQIVGGITLDNIRKGAAQAGTVGYWIGMPFVRHGYMREALGAVVSHAFRELELSRVEAACLPENVASRGLLETSGFKYEGVAQSYLQIAGRWRTHVLYANLRIDRRGKVEM